MYPSRLLVFSPSPIVSVRLSVDGRRLADPSQVGTSPLYTAPWQPEAFAAGLHTISVSVKVSVSIIELLLAAFTGILVAGFCR